jgi:hypothetical protein
MARPRSDITPPADALPEDSHALMARAAAGTAELDVQRMTAERLQQYAPLMQAVGRIQAAHLFATVADSVIAQTFSDVRKAKNYVGIPYQDADGHTRRVADLEEFCQAFLGRSYSRCLELANNLHALGPELYERAQEVGWRTKDYRALRALPSDDQAAVREALDSDDRDAALTVLSDLVARQQQARESAERARDQAQAAEAEIRANYEAATGIVGEREAELRQLKGAGKLPPPTLDAATADWGPSATYCIGEAKRWLVQLGHLLEQAARLEPAGDSEAELSAHQKALALVDDAAGPGLVELGDLVGALTEQLDAGVTAKRWQARGEGDVMSAHADQLRDLQ